MYKAILFSPDGDFVTDFRNRETKQDVWDELANMGSRWIFYPIAFVATDTTIVDTPEGMEHLKGKRTKTVQKYLQDFYNVSPDSVCDLFNSGFSLRDIYQNTVIV